jgi:DNA-directed RNA polymerase specialized sigma24 family protein
MRELQDDDDRKPGEPPAEDEPVEENLDPVAALREWSGPGATDAERMQMLKDEGLRAKILGVFRKKGVPEQAFDDVLQVTMIAAVRAADLPRGAGKERDQYVLATAGYKAVDYLRSAARNVPLEDGAEADAVAPAHAQVDLVAERDLLTKVLAVGAGDREMVVLYTRYKLNEERLKDIAADADIPYEALRKRIRDFEDRLRERAQKLRKYGRISSAIALLLAMGLGGWEMRPAPGMSIDTPGPLSGLEPAVSTHVTQVDPLDWAAALRGEAFRACMHDDWEPCLSGLDAARELDPDGDVDPAVHAARADAFNGLTFGLKSGPPWRPNGPRSYAAKASR